jgi:hypothetical protein
MLAGITKTAELALDQNESKMLAQAIADVAKFYPVAVDPKTIAWINLTMVAGMVYGPRIVAIAYKPPKEKPDNVRPFAAGKPN